MLWQLIIVNIFVVAAIVSNIFSCYNWYVVRLPDTLNREGGEFMEYIFSFLISIMAGIVSYYICKWLDDEI